MKISVASFMTSSNMGTGADLSSLGDSVALKTRISGSMLKSLLSSGNATQKNNSAVHTTELHDLISTHRWH